MLIGNTNHQKLEIMMNEWRTKLLIEGIGEKLKEKVKERKNGTSTEK